MVSHLFKALLGTLRKVYKSVPFQATLWFFVMYTCLTIFSLPLLLLVFYRWILSMVLKFWYRGNLKLADSYSATMSALDSFAGVINITYFLYIKGHCDIQELRKRVSKRILARNENGNQPYEILLNSSTEKFGFTCLSDKSHEIDFKNHVRLCPGAGADDPDRIYSEHEFLDAVAKLADCEWEESKPKWEILVTPRVKKEGSDQILAAVTVKFHHVYVDGISLAQFVRNCIFDQPVSKLKLDPVNPPFPPLSLYQKILLGLQMFFMGPYISLRLFGNDYDPVFTQGPLVGGKLIGRTKMPITLEMMRRIRKLHNCSTDAVLHSAFLGSFQTMAKRKGIKLPDEITAAVILANFPYKDEYPTNNASFGYEPVTINITDPLLRLAEMNKCIVNLCSRLYALKVSVLLTKLMGLFPAAVVRAASKSYRMAYNVSNVPGTIDSVKIDANDVELACGIGPLFNRIRHHAGVSFYRGSFNVVFFIEPSKNISNREELEEWIREFEAEIRCLDMRAKGAL